MHSQPVGKVAKRKEERKERILVTAERLLSEKGFHNTGIADIASELSMGHGTFYSYFKNKQDIAEHVLLRAFDLFVAAVLTEDPGAGDSLTSYKEQVSALLMSGLILAESEPHRIRVLFQESHAIDREFLERMNIAFVTYTEGFLRNGIDKGFLRREMDVTLTAQMLVALIFDGTKRALRDPDRDACVARKNAGMALMFEGIACR